MKPILPTDQAARNAIPLADGCLYYFPNALAAVAALSKVANEQHNPGEPMHWARNKSTDHANKILKHLVDAGLMDVDGVRHSAKVAWRALALLEDELIAAGAVPGRNTKGAPGGGPRQMRESKIADDIRCAPKGHRHVASADELRAAGLHHLIISEEGA